MKVEVFSGPNCGYCKRAKALFEAKGIPFVDFDISDAAHRDEMLRRLPRVRAIPQIFIGGKHIGGFEDLEDLDGDGRLDEMLGRRDTA